MRARQLWRQLRRSRLSSASLVVLSALVALALFADLIAADLPILLRFQGTTYVLPNITRPAGLRAQDNQRLRRELARSGEGWAVMPLCEYGPEQQPEILRPPPAPPDAVHWLGTDDRGRDVFARLVHGARVSMLVGALSVSLYVLLGLLLGLFAGYRGGWTDAIISRVVEIGLTFPTFFLILIVLALVEQASILTMVLVIGLTRWTGVARLVRAEALHIRELDYVMAARAAGAGGLRIMFRHVLPNALPPVLVAATFGVAGVMVVESALTFLGFGVPPPTASWGEVLSQAFEYPDRWWLTVFPGALLFLTVTSLNLFGEALRDAIDPRMRDF